MIDSFKKPKSKPLERTFLHVFLLGALLLNSCKEKETHQSYCSQSPDNCQSIQEAKDFFAFKMGSWWVYEEETTLQRDSMYVIQSAIDPNSYQFDVRIQSALTGYRYHYWPEYYGNKTGCNENGGVNNRCLYVKRSKGKAQDYQGENNCFFVKYQIDSYDYTGSSVFCENKIIFSDIQTTSSLGTFNFKKTIEITETCSQNEKYQKTKTTYAQHVGIIRKELVDSNQVWNLVSYHIVK